jgi:5-methylcytosine-specific restriction endonuclease McrA
MGTCIKCDYPIDIYDGYCTPRHKFEQRFEKQQLTLVKQCVVCDLTFKAKSKTEVACSPNCKIQRGRDRALSHYHANKQIGWVVYKAFCSWCEQTYLVVSDSRVAPNRQHDACRPLARRASYRVKTVKRQGVKSPERITHEEVAYRDNFICHICNELVDMNLPRTSRMGATLDHVYPISKGGVDSLDNLKLAHWICNIRKSNKLIGDEDA